MNKIIDTEIVAAGVLLLLLLPPVGKPPFLPKCALAKQAE